MSTSAQVAGYAEPKDQDRLRRPVVAPDAVDYPEGDEERVGESDWHMVALAYLVSVLKHVFAAARDVFVAGDMFVYYEEGNKYARVAPDVMVIRGVPNRPRRSYRLFEEQQVPCCVVEIVSESSWPDDVESKREFYAGLGVREYFVCDPPGEFLDPPLARFRLAEGGEYVRTDGVSLDSAELGLRFAVENGQVRVYDLATGAPYLGYGDERAAREREQAARKAAEQARRGAEAEVARLRAELERLQADERGSTP